MGALPVAEQATRASGCGRQMTMPLVSKEYAGLRNSSFCPESKNLPIIDNAKQNLGAKIFRLHFVPLKMTRKKEGFTGRLPWLLRSLAMTF